MKKSSPNSSAPFAYEGLDRAFHERARLSVLTSLVTHSVGLSFVELKKLCALTDGNLARHLQVLELEGIVRLTKEEDGGRAQTTARITVDGRKRFLEYLSILEQVVGDAAFAKRKSKGTLIPADLSPSKN